MKNPSVAWCGLICLLFGGLFPAFEAAAVWGQSASPREVVARVGGVEIRLARVEAYLQRTVPGWPLALEQQEPLRAAAVEHLVNRQLVLQALHQQGIKATTAELEWKLDELRAELAEVGRKLDEYLVERDLTVDELRNDLDWELSWRKYLAKTLTEDRLAERFRSRPRDFDGTELHVAQILLPAEAKPSQLGGLPAAEQLRDNLVSGKMEWSAAVREHSGSPSREREGDLGWIRRREPMPEVFSEAAFGLNVGEVSAPVVSKFGIHLIKCLDVRPGKQQLGDVRNDVYRVAMEEEFRRLAAETSSRVEVWLRPQR